MAEVGRFIADHPYIVAFCLIAVCAMGFYVYKGGKMTIRTIRIKDWLELRLGARGRQGEREMQPRISGLWCDIFKVNGDKRVAVLQITYGPKGYSIEGEQFDSKLEPMEHWASRMAERRDFELEYLYHAETPANSGRNSVTGFTSLKFHGTQGDILATYAGYYVSAWRDKQIVHPESNDLTGRRLHQEEVALCSDRKLVAKYVFDHGWK